MAVLDPTVELKIAEFKGTGDFLDFAPLCSTYVVGVDEDALHQGAAILMWGLAEAERRGRRILQARERGLAPEGKVTPELARAKGSGLHPVVIIIDEAHELFAAIPEAATAAERLIKRARALGIMLVLATQIPDKSSLPPNITRCVTNRWCLSVGGQVENDMILGTGAYKRGLTGTVYRPVVDAGWGCMTGGPVPTAVRSQYPDQDTTEAILARALALRGESLAASTDQPEARDLLADLAEVSGSNGQHWGPAGTWLSVAENRALAHTAADDNNAAAAALQSAIRNLPAQGIPNAILARAHSLLAYHLGQAGRLDEALRYAELSVEELAKLYKQQGLLYLRDLISAASTAGDLSQRMGADEQALQYHQLAYARAITLSETDPIEGSKRLSTSGRAVAGLLIGRSQPEAARFMSECLDKLTLSAGAESTSTLETILHFSFLWRSNRRPDEAIELLLPVVHTARPIDSATFYAWAFLAIAYRDAEPPWI